MTEPSREQHRQAVRQLHAEGTSRNAIARSIRRSAATVSKIAREEGLTFSGGAQVAAATEARRADVAAQREQLVPRQATFALS
ncbi:hypothetical protein [Streptomyces calidiresistens]|uniref:Helix-turn-helix domain-containing protein n=1 Tax=Streptomyces calidiresistens TaxID=1485586 RepID=A0A7W3T7M9_9ACTN|nr:hypothetical protein [Streptomyces calidiresistens]MBB0232429.1 hypothetical protein [Streptomyces calidiresistens]